jgi:hypothetical protein
MSTDTKAVDQANQPDQPDLAALAADIKSWGQALGFGAVGISDVDASAALPRLADWLAQGRHGEMDYMARHAHLRADPQQLLPRAARVISARLDYRPGVLEPAADEADWIARETARLTDGTQAVVSLYARGREARMMVAIVGEAGLSPADRRALAVAEAFERELIHQGTKRRTIDETLEAGWKLMDRVPREDLIKLSDQLLASRHEQREAAKKKQA